MSQSNREQRPRFPSLESKKVDPQLAIVVPPAFERKVVSGQGRILPHDIEPFGQEVKGLSISGSESYAVPHGVSSACCGTLV